MTQTGSAAGEHGRIDALDGLRGIAVLLVLMLHCRLYPQGIDVPVTAVDQFLIHVLTFGWAGVDLFFVLSGYLITGILVRTRDDPHYFRNFYARRVLRIFPLYYAVVLARLYVFPAASGYGGLEQASYLSYWSNFWQATHVVAKDHDDVVLVTWSLAIEEQFYLVWPLLAWWCRRRWLVVVALVLVVAAPVLRALLQHGGEHFWAIYVMTPCRVDTLAAGALLALAGTSSPRALRRAGVLLCAAAACVLVWVFVRDGSAYWGPSMQVAGYSANAALGAGCVALALAGGPFAWLCRTRLLRTFGRYSYAVYLLHLPVVMGLSRLLLDRDAPLPLLPLYRAAGMHLPAWALLFCLCAGASLLAAVVSWHVLEKHCLALKRHFAPRGGAG